MTVPLLDLNAQHATLGPQLRDAFERVVQSGQFVLGPSVERFESQLAEYVGAPHAIGVSSGTDALLVSMMALGIGPGDEVITSPFTFLATAGCVARLGARPVFVDIDGDTLHIDAKQIEDAVTPATRAIIPVHLFGLPAAMPQIMQIARKHRLKVIEDAAQALGARCGDRFAGAVGDLGCFSFYPTKNLAALGDGGAVVTGDAELAARIGLMRAHGCGDGICHEFVGGNFRIDALQAELLSLKIGYLDGWTLDRRNQADRYAALLGDLPVRLPIEPAGTVHVYNPYTIRVCPSLRDALCTHLSAQGIGNRIYYPVPLHLQPCFANLGHGAGDFPVAELAAQEVLSLPIFPEMTGDQQQAVAESIDSFFQSK